MPEWHSSGLLRNLVHNLRVIGVLLPLLFGILHAQGPDLEKPQDPQDRDVVQSFEQYIADYINSYKADRRDYVYQLPNGKWQKDFFEPADKRSIDVRRTDSLISPFTAICEFELSANQTAAHDSKEQAQLDYLAVKTEKVSHRHVYAFQNGHWVVKKRQHLDTIGFWSTCDDCWARTGKPTSDIQGCWEPNTNYNLNRCGR